MGVVIGGMLLKGRIPRRGEMGRVGCFVSESVLHFGIIGRINELEIVGERSRRRSYSR